MNFLLQIFAFEMKFILVPILLLLMLAQSFSKWIVVMEYNLNKDFIAKNLCINKSRPKMHCNGKCQMMKRLAEEEKQNTSNNTLKIKVHDIVLSDVINKPVLPLPVAIKILYNEEPPSFLHEAPVASIFHPPALG